MSSILYTVSEYIQSRYLIFSQSDKRSNFCSQVIAGADAAKKRLSHKTLHKTNVTYKSFEIPDKSLPKEESATVGVRASGVTVPFGRYGGDCSLNWNDTSSFGGGFNTGITNRTNGIVMGIGGGFNYNHSTLNVGAGINAFNQKVNYQMFITEAGNITVKFDSTTPLHCDTISEGEPPHQTITCTPIPPPEPPKSPSELSIH